MTDSDRIAAHYLTQENFLQAVLDSLPEPAVDHYHRWERAIAAFGRATNLGELRTTLSFAQSIELLVRALTERLASPVGRGEAEKLAK